MNGAAVLPPNDVRIIGGRLSEAVNDCGWQTILAMYPKQPMNFDGRTGTVAFDVNLDSEGIHAAWPEFWITDQPVPIPNAATDISGHQPAGRNSFGVKFAQQCDASNGSIGGHGPRTSVDSMWISRNYATEQVDFVRDTCVAKGSPASPNHVEVRMSASRVEVWASDPGGANLRMIAHAALQMPLVQGLVWMEDVHYNGDKFDSQADHGFVWDNFGFDGPKTYRDLSFDVPDGSPTNLAVDISQPVVVRGVHHGDKTPTGAYVLFSFFTGDTHRVPSISVNGGPVVATAFPPITSPSFKDTTIAVPIDPALVRDGDNTIRFTTSTQTVVQNVNLVLVNAQSVP